MKFKLINRQTNEEHICDKLTIDEFDYYVSDNKIQNENPFIDLRNSELDIEDIYWADLGGTAEFANAIGRLIVATTHPNIDIPKVTDEITEVFKNHFDIDSIDDFPKTVGDTNIIEYFKEGYNKSQQDFPFSENDMLEFGDWLINVCNSNWELNKNCYITGVASTVIRNTKELLDIWKEQQLKVLYYEV